MSSSGALIIRFIGDTRDFSRATSTTQKQVSSFGSKVDKAGRMAGRGLAVGLTVGSVALFKATKAAAADEQAQVRLAEVLRKAGGASKSQIAATESWITAQGKATGITDDELRPALARLTAATHDVGKAQKLASLAQDVASGSGKSYKSVTEALAKAQNGNVTGLQRLGIKTTDATGKTKSLQQITKDLAGTYGGSAAKAADTAAGKQKILTTQLSELGEKIGGVVLPAMGKMVDIGLQVTDWVSNHTKLVGILVGVIATFAAGIWAASAAIKAWTVISKLAAAASKIWAAGQWLLNAALNANPISLVILAIAALVAGVIIAYKKSETFRKIVDAALRGIGIAGKWMWDHALKPAFNAFVAGIKAVGKIGTWLWNNVFQPVFHFIVKGIATVLGMWAKMLGTLAKVPGFGWAKKAADAMAAAANKANDLANKIKKIPSTKNVDVNIHYNYSGLQNPDRGHGGDPGLPPPSPKRSGRAPITPVPRGRGFGMDSTTGGQPVTINATFHLDGDPQQNAEAVRKALLRLKRQLGTPLGLA